MSISNNINSIKNKIPNEVTLIAVSKTKPIEDIQQAYDAGQRVFGENKIQEMVEKYDTLPKDISWHMIGHLQRNKVKYMAHFVDLIHGVNSLKTLLEINKQASKHNRIIKCLLQIKISKEETKFGIPYEEVGTLIASETFTSLQNIKVIGFMGMASNTKDTKIVTREFSTLKHFFDEQKQLSTFNFQLSTLSMGMSGDYSLAIEQGSTMIRVGSAIFGHRNYK